jgi:excisionase family DNA binding protein
MRPNVTTSSSTNARNQPQRNGPQTLASLFANPHANPHTDSSRAPPQAVDPSPEQECMTADELASLLRVNRKTVYEYAARNVIPCRRLGRRLVFSLPAIRAWLARSSGSDPAPSMLFPRRR